MTPRPIQNSRWGKVLPPEVSAVLAKLTADDRELLNRAVADIHRIEVADLWEQRDLAVSYWVLMTTGVNQADEMRVAAELLCWKHFFAKDTASVRCIQSSDQREAECCFCHFGNVDFPTLAVGDTLTMENFVLLGPAMLESLARKPGALHLLLSRVHQWLVNGMELRELDGRLRSPAVWSDARLGISDPPVASSDGVLSSWRMQPSPSMEARQICNRVKWVRNRYEELAKYVDRHAEGIEYLLGRARVILGTGFGGMRSLTKIAADREIACALYEAIRGNSRLSYDFEPATPGEEYQPILFTRRVAWRLLVGRFCR